MFTQGRRIRIEIERADVPKLTPSMRIAMADLKLAGRLEIYPGAKSYEPALIVDVVPASAVAQFVE